MRFFRLKSIPAADRRGREGAAACLALALLIVMFSSSCQCDPEAPCTSGDTQDNPDVGYRVGIQSGDGQVGPANQFLTNDVVAFVTDPAGNALTSSVQCVFTPRHGGIQVPGGATVSAQTAVDAAVTLCSVRWRSTSPGIDSMKVEFSISGKRIPNYEWFTATFHGPASRVEIVTGDGQTGEANAELPVRTAIKVVDALGLGVPGYRVWFVPQDGGQPNAGEVPNTSKFGVASMPSRWQLGPAAGTQRLIARVLDGQTGVANAQVQNNPATFTATAGPPAPRSVARHPASFPEPQSGYTGKAVAMRPAVRVLDAGGYPIEGVSVGFSIDDGGGSFGGITVMRIDSTDANGIAALPLDWILGMPGLNSVQANVHALGVANNPIVFTANTITNTLPTVSITAPADGISVQAGTPLQFRGHADDAEDGRLGAAALRWRSSLMGALGIDSILTQTLTAGTHDIRLTATDAAGDSAFTTITVTVTDSYSASISGRASVSGYGVGGATITLNGALVQTSTQTDGNGNYSFTGLPGGTYTMTISAGLNIDFGPAKLVTLGAGQALIVNFAGSY
jgi:hypothetical protein